MSEQQNTQVVQDAYAAFKRGDVASVVAKLAGNVEWYIPGEGLYPQAGLYRGPDAVAGFFAKLGASTDFDAFEPREYTAQGDRVIASGYYHGKSKATGRSFESEWCMAFTIQNGKIVRFREYTDTASLGAAYQGAIAA